MNTNSKEKTDYTIGLPEEGRLDCRHIEKTNPLVVFSLLFIFIIVDSNKGVYQSSTKSDCPLEQCNVLIMLSTQ